MNSQSQSEAYSNQQKPSTNSEPLQTITQKQKDMVLFSRQKSIDQLTENEKLFEQRLAFERSFRGDLQNQIRYLQSQLQTSRQQNIALNEKMIALRQQNKDQIRYLQRQLQTSRSQNIAFHEEMIALRRKNDKLSRRLTVMELQNQKLTEKEKLLDESLAYERSFRGDLQNLSNRLANLNSQNTSLSNRVAQKEQENVELQSQITNLFKHFKKQQNEKILSENSQQIQEISKHQKRKSLQAKNGGQKYSAKTNFYHDQREASEAESKDPILKSVNRSEGNYAKNTPVHSFDRTVGKIIPFKDSSDSINQ